MSKKILGNKDKGLIFVISAPAGTGKSTLVEMLRLEFPETIVESCSVTTRPPRPGEVALMHYEFVSHEQFEEKIQNKEFLEYANVFGNYYGTPRKQVGHLLDRGKHVILVIDTQGAMQLREKGISATFIFISPPSIEELKRRLSSRKTEDEEKMRVRLEWAKKEMELAVYYDYHVINDNLVVSYQILRSILIAEEHKNL